MNFILLNCGLCSGISFVKQGIYMLDFFSPSFSQLDTSTWNIDMQELEYNPSKKDLTDAKIHHLLAEELCKPRRVSTRGGGLNFIITLY